MLNLIQHLIQIDFDQSKKFFQNKLRIEPNTSTTWKLQKTKNSEIL